MKFSKELKIGIFVVIILLVSFFVINFLRGKDIFNKEIQISAYCSDAQGLVASAPVYIKGYKAGSVSSVAYLPDKDLFEVTCSVLKQFRIPEDSKIVIYSVDIMGGKGVRIDAGTSEVMAVDGSVMVSASEADLISTVSSGIGPLMSKLDNVIDSLSITVSSINSILGPENREELERTLKHLGNTVANAEKLSSDIGGRSSELTAFIDSLSSLSSTLGSTLVKADDAMGSISSIASSIDESDLEGTIVSLRALLDKLQDPDGSLGKLMVDDSVYDNLDSLLSDVDTLVKKIQDNPKKYIKISIF